MSARLRQRTHRGEGVAGTPRRRPERVRPVASAHRRHGTNRCGSRPPADSRPPWNDRRSGALCARLPMACVRRGAASHSRGRGRHRRACALGWRRPENGQTHAHRRQPPGRDPRGGGERNAARGIRFRIGGAKAAQGERLSRQGDARGAFAPGGLCGLRRQPPRLPPPQRNPPGLLPDPRRRPRSALRGAGERGPGAAPRLRDAGRRRRGRAPGGAGRRGARGGGSRRPGARRSGRRRTERRPPAGRRSPARRFSRAGRRRRAGQRGRGEERERSGRTVRRRRRGPGRRRDGRSGAPSPPGES